MVIPTHPDADHISGQVAVLQRYKVKQVLYPDMPSETFIYTEWQSQVAREGAERTIARAGQRISLGKGVTIEVLNPPVPPFEDTGYNEDNNGVVLRLTMGKVSFLFTGDIRQTAEDQLIIQRASLNSTVLKVAHHGSDSSTSPGFLAAVSPQLAVISAGRDNRYGHPHEMVVNLLTATIGEHNIYRTDERGTVEFVTDGERLWVRTGGSR